MTDRLRIGEFIPLMAMMISLVALSIDAMLPALPEIGQSLGGMDGNQTQLVVTSLFLGLGFGQLVYGPLSDSIGRKPAIYLGNAIFLVGCFLSLTAQSFDVMLLGRVLQGFGAAGNRTVIMAIVRDMYDGRRMARIMSFVMAVFILVPAIAPSLGQLVMFAADWRMIFAMFIVVGAVALTWFAVRQPESISREHRKKLSLKGILRDYKTAFSHRVTLGYTIATGFVFGPFIGYLSSAQQIFQDAYGVGDKFPIYFASLVLATGAAAMTNGKFVMRYGMRRLSRGALSVVIGLSLIFLPIVTLFEGIPPLFMFISYMMVLFFAMGMLFGNLQVLAMDPMAEIAGTASAFVSAFSTAVSIPIGLLIGQAFDNSVLPLVMGFAACAACSLIAGYWADKGRAPGPILETDAT